MTEGSSSSGPLPILINIRTSEGVNQHSFDYFPVSIGGKGDPSTDLAIPLASLPSQWLILQWDAGEVVAWNAANDPFLTKNGAPFHRVSLLPGDSLAYRDLTLTVEYSLPSSSPPEEKGKKDPASLQAYLTKEEWAQLASSQEEERVLSKLLEEWEKQKPSLAKEEQPPAKRESLPLPKTRNEGFVIDEFDDEPEHWEQPSQQTLSPRRKFSWKWAAILSGIALVLFCCSSFWFVMHQTLQNEAGELKAAEAVSDLAMALMYAKVYEIKPENRNWASTEFLKANLLNVLASTYRPAVSIQQQGKFFAGNYSVRIYTDKDLSHFVLIAQPSPRVFHFFATPSAIALDSSSMKLHKIEDLRALNRLLANPNPLEGVNGTEISHLITAGKVVRLSQIGEETSHLEFSPPRGLPWLSPGAENLIYNAPRYYKFCQSFLQKAVAFSVQEGEGIDQLRKECEAFRPLASFVFYSSQGKGAAILAQKAIQKIAPENRWMMGYLCFHLNGEISSSHLLKENGPRGHLIGEPSTDHSGDFDMAKISLEEHDSEESSLVDFSDPLYLALSQIAQERQEILGNITEEWILLLKRDLEAPQPEFSDILQDLSCSWEYARQDQEIKIRSELARLQEEYSSIPFSHFHMMVKTLGLDSFLGADSSDQEWKEKSQQNEGIIDEWLFRIQQSTNWEELASRAVEAASFLKLSHVPQSDQLSRFQNRVRNTVIGRLDDFLFSSHYHLALQNFREKDRMHLEDILKTAWIADQEEQNFYLQAFDSFLLHSSTIANER